jgi:CSLREA domain-containing protein
MERRRFGLLVVCLLLASPAGAVVYTVNSAGDGVDANTADGICETSTPGVCTLRAAVQQANVTGGTINVPAITITLTGPISIAHDMSIVGAGMRSTVVSGNGLYGIFRVSVSRIVTITDMTLRDGHVDGPYAAAIDFYQGALTVDRCLFTNNYASSGGAILLYNADATIRDSVFTDNHATEGAPGGIGGAVWTLGAGYTLTMIDVALTANTANFGGALCVSGGYATLTNVTIGGNTAYEDGGGAVVAGVLEGVGASISLSNSTLVGNRAYSHGGGVYLNNADQIVTVKNSILASNLVGAPNQISAFSNCYGTIQSLGNSIVTPSFACGVTGSVSTATPMLGPLQDNGGPNGPTYALLSGSPARDGGTVGGCPLKDQRGVQRQTGVACDMGAFEHGPCGDANGDGSLNVSDVFFLINSLFAGGPVPPGLANVNGDSAVTVADVFALINKLFAGGSVTCPGT